MKIHGLILAAITVIVLAFATVGRADSADDDFVDALATQGIVGDRDELIGIGHKICDDVSQVPTTLPGWERFVAGHDVMNTLNITPHSAAFAIRAAERAYCPEYLESSHP